jgi:hypothetical protein
VDQEAQDGIRAKLERADLHLRALAGEVSAYLDGEPHTYSTDADYNAGSYSIRIAIKSPPPVQLGVTCGDYIHCLRSALDHLISGEVPKSSNKTGFPIHRSGKDFFTEVVTAAWKNENGPLTSLDPEGALFAYIQGIQPYRGQDGYASKPLWLLRELSNADKHRTILARAASHERVKPGTIRFKGTDIDYLGEAALVYDQPLVDGAKVLSGQFRVTGPNPQVQVQGHIPIDIAFGEALVPSKSLHRLMDGVREVIDKAFVILGLPPL